MQKRFVSIWFRHLTTDWLALRRPELKAVPFVSAAPVRGRMIITAANKLAELEGIKTGMAVADAKAMITSLKVVDDIPGKGARLLEGLGKWCIRYTPLIAIDLPDGLLLDVSGCAHLWGGEPAYLQHIIRTLTGKGYDTRGAMADTAGAAWAVARYGRLMAIIEPGKQADALLPLPPEALRLEPVILERLQKLGFYTIKSFIGLSRSALRRRLGDGFLLRLNQALGNEDEHLQLLQPAEPYQERLPCLEPVVTVTAIETAILTLLQKLCGRLRSEGKGLRSAVLTYYRIDGKTGEAAIGTNRASHDTGHLFSLFELNIQQIEPALGIELFIMDASKVDDAEPAQEVLWAAEDCGLEHAGLAGLLDRLANKIGPGNIHRYLPRERYWPERAVKVAASLQEKKTAAWRTDRPRPSLLLPRPECIEVTAPVPDYPPILFRYKGVVHYIKKADGPERIEREWWVEAGEHRDYYCVEDAEGRRYWLFRSGHYDAGRSQWFLHGFLA